MSASRGPGRLQLFAWATLAALLMIAAAVVNRHSTPPALVRVVLALLPVVPLAALAWAISRAIGELDEMQRRIHLDAMTGAFVASAFVAVIVGQLQDAGVGMPELNWAFFWPAQVVLWAIAYVAAARRYQ
jgi:hypothetical protein